MPHHRRGAKAREGYYKWIVEKANEEGRDALEYMHEQRDQNSEANKLFSMNLAKSRDDAMMKKMSYVRTPEEHRRYDIDMKEMKDLFPGFTNKQLYEAIHSIAWEEGYD